MTDTQTTILGQTKEAAPKKRMRRPKKPAIIVSILFVVIAAGAVGFGIWHEQPSFCNAICHSPMDTYYESYDEGTGMARIHKEAHVTCLDCHETSFGQQLSEAWTWVIGDFSEPLDMMNYDDSTCLTCHISEEFQAAKTDLIEFNPHADAHQALACTDCHKSHNEQVNYCSNCHDNGGQRMITWPLEGHQIPEAEEKEAS